MKLKILFAVSSVLFLMWTAVRLFMALEFHRHCGDHLLNAVEADTIEVAEQELQTAVTYIDAEILNGESMSEDVVAWADSLRADLKELRLVNHDASEFKKNRALAQLKKSLVVEGTRWVNSIPVGGYRQAYKEVTIPLGISVYPHNTIFSIWGFGSGALLFITFIWLLIRWLQRW